VLKIDTNYKSLADYGRNMNVGRLLKYRLPLPLIQAIKKISYWIRDVKRTTDPTSTLDVLKEEIKEINGADISSVVDADTFTSLAHAHYPRTALCLSGGGIRSAAFALGVVQWLNKAKLLNQFQYLSTVSGGGYIGAWLSAWIYNEPKGYSEVSKSLMRTPNSSYEPSEIRRLRENSQFITPRSGALSGDTWSAIAITLRNLLLNWLVIVPFIAALCITPQIMALIYGMTFAKKWGPEAVVLSVIFYFICFTYIQMSRTTWGLIDFGRVQFYLCCFVPGFISVLSWTAFVASQEPYNSNISSNFASPVVQLIPLLSPKTNEIVNHMLLYGLYLGLLHAGACAMTAVVYVIRRRTKPHITVRGHPVATMQPDVIPYKPFLAIPFEFILSRTSKNAITATIRTEDRQAVNGIHYMGFEKKEVEIAAGEDKALTYVHLLEHEINGVAIDYSDFKLQITKASVEIDRSDQRSIAIRDSIASIIGGFVIGCCLGLVLYYCHVWYSSDLFQNFCRTSPDNKFIPSEIPPELHQLNQFPYRLAWLILIVTCLLPPLTIACMLIGELSFVASTSLLPGSDDDREWLGRASGSFLLAAIGWLILTSATLLMPALLSSIHSTLNESQNLVVVLASIGLGSGIITAVLGTGPKTSASDRADSSWRGIILYVATGTFLVCLASILAIAIDIVALGHLFLDTLENSDKIPDYLLRLLLSGIVLCAAAAFIGYYVNVNRFSLHAMYRNRLVRTFLGASNRRQSARNKFTWFNERDNIEMHRLWQRKSDPPRGDRWRPYHVINVALNVVAGKNLAWQERKAESFVFTPMYCGAADLNAFRRSSEYAGRDKAITLGTAMAISGAAVSPNMGYNSSPIVTFLLTLFNVRLGWWFGNPKNKHTYLNEGPRFAIKPLLSEALGMTTDRAPYVYLSDGGHFENLGLYEMVRRRSHLIILSDAGHDPECSLADLANATRKIYIDFGIPISFPELNSLRKRNDCWRMPEDGGPGFTIGIIDYAAVDKEAARQGIILYVKPTIRGDEPADVLGHAASNYDFPHDSTADQWFKEARFESYRALGFETMIRAHAAASAADGSARLNGFGNLQNFLSALQSRVQKFRH